MFSKIKSDFRRYYHISINNPNPSYFKKLRLFIKEPGLQAVVVFRFGSWISTSNLSPIYFLKLTLLPVYYVFEFFIRKLYDISIDRKAHIGRALYIGHFSGIIVDTSVIGENCSIHQHVKILADKHLGKNTIVGDNVWIGPHAVIQPGTIIHKNSTVAAGSVIETDITGPSLVMGTPGRVVLNNYDNSELL